MILIADKRLTYAGRVYRPGASFSAKRAHARLLEKTGWARPAPIPPASESEAAELRFEYERRSGRKPDGRWSLERLRREVDAL